MERNLLAIKNLVGKRLAENIIVEEMEEVVDDETGEMSEALNRKIIFERDHELTEDDYGMLEDAELKKFSYKKYQKKNLRVQR